MSVFKTDYWLRSMLIALMLASPALSMADAAPAEAPPAQPSEAEQRLLRLTTLEGAFLGALENRRRLQRFLLQEQARLEQAESDEEREKLEAGLETARTRLRSLVVAMDVVFGVGDRRVRSRGVAGPHSVPSPQKAPACLCGVCRIGRGKAAF